MVTTIKHFIEMGGHGFYVWSAYGSVVLYLTLQWFFLKRSANE